MKFLVGLIGSFITLVILRLLNAYVFKFTISEFMVGWVCCLGLHISVYIYKKHTKHNGNN